MDLNDPRRRLQVVQQANPSIRVSVAPPPTTRPQVVVNSAPPNVQKTLSVTRGPAYTPPAPKPHPTVLDFLADTTKGFGEGVAGTLSETARNVVQGSDNLVTTLSKAVSNDAEDKKIDARRAQRSRAIDGFFPKQQNQEVETAGEITALLAPSGVTNKIQKVGEGLSIIKNLAQGNALQKAAAWFLPKAAESASSTALSTQLPGQQTKGLDRQVGEGLAIDTAVQAGLGVFGKVAKAFKGSKSVSSLIAQTDDPQVIDTTLQQIGVASDPQTRNIVATYLASETDPNVVKDVIKSLEVDPSLQLSPELLKRLEKEGIRKVEKGDTPYGAQYQDGTIRFADQSQVNDKTGYHELGHHLFINQMTPEEKALFKANPGEASKLAKGRDGYTDEDLVSEDFSDYFSKAMTGRMDEVPEALRPVIKKYAQLPEEDIAAIKAAGGVPPTIS